MEFDLLDLIECPDATACTVFSKLKECLDGLVRHGAPVRNFKGFCSDPTNLMMGPHKSIARLIKEAYPWVFIVKCACHLILLVVSYTCKKLPKTSEDLIRNIHSHFSHSAKRVNSLKAFQDFLEIDNHRILSPGQSRYLFVHSCIRRILEQWDALTLHFTEAVFDDSTHGNGLALGGLKNPFLRIMMMFMD